MSGNEAWNRNVSEGCGHRSFPKSNPQDGRTSETLSAYPGHKHSVINHVSVRRNFYLQTLIVSFMHGNYVSVFGH